jgi:peptide chain release factor 1
MIQGAGAKATFAQEAGGHRWQRVSPTEKRGRVHTSTVTVAVLDTDDINATSPLKMEEITIQTVRGSGPGGQHRNKTETCVVVTHEPTNTTVRIDGRSQSQNKQAALKLIAARVHELNVQRQVGHREEQRRDQVGSGMRGDKIRTYRSQDDQVTDHRTGQRWRLRDWLKGNW